MPSQPDSQTCQGRPPDGHLVCEACGNWTAEPAEHVDAELWGMAVVEVDDGDMLLCEWCL